VPIYRLFAGQAFEPEHCRAMALAYEALLEELGLTDRTDPLCDMVALKVVEFGQRGVREPSRLHELTLEAIRG
jgi:hypothetical protein